MDFGARLKEKRTELCLSQEQLADSLGVTRQTIANWEKGKTYPDIGSVIKLSDLYGMSLDWLLKGEKTQVAEEEVTEEYVEEVVTEKGSDYMDAYSIVNKKNIEIIGISVILVLSCQFPLIGLFVPPIVLFWMIKTDRRYKIVYILCICSLVISLYNTYVIFEHLFFDWGKSSIEEISSLW